MKSIIITVLLILFSFSIFAEINGSVLVEIPETVNLGITEKEWLPGQIQDKLKSNLQDYLQMKIASDSRLEENVKKIQAESESYAHDENTAIELGKIVSAKYALFSTIRKTGSSYTLSANFTDLTTGEQKASATSQKEYLKPELLYASTGAVDEITVLLANKLDIQLSELNKELLTKGSENLSVDAQLALAKQNDEQFQKKMNDYDAELSKLELSNDVESNFNKNKIQAEKALLLEKQKAEKRQQQLLEEQKKRLDEDMKLESKRSDMLKRQREQLAKDANQKANSLKTLKNEKQDAISQINIIEAKKKSLIEMNQKLENQCSELYEQMQKDKTEAEQKISNRPFGSGELGSNGEPTNVAQKRRAKQIKESNEKFENDYAKNAEALRKVVETPSKKLLSEIRSDQKALTKTKTASSLTGELKINYGKYEGNKNGWNAYLSLYSSGILLYEDVFIVNYEAVSGKKATDLNVATNLEVDAYNESIDMYSSLLLQGTPLVYFELDYNVTAEPDEKPSTYKFNFKKIRIINTMHKKSTSVALNKKLEKTIEPTYDIQEFSKNYGTQKIAKQVESKNEVSNTTVKTKSTKIKKAKTRRTPKNQNLVLIGFSFYEPTKEASKHRDVEENIYDISIQDLFIKSNGITFGAEFAMGVASSDDFFTDDNTDYGFNMRGEINLGYSLIHTEHFVLGACGIFGLAGNFFMGESTWTEYNQEYYRKWMASTLSVTIGADAYLSLMLSDNVGIYGKFGIRQDCYNDISYDTSDKVRSYYKDSTDYEHTKNFYGTGSSYYVPEFGISIKF